MTLAEYQPFYTKTYTTRTDTLPKYKRNFSLTGYTTAWVLTTLSVLTAVFCIDYFIAFRTPSMVHIFLNTVFAISATALFLTYIQFVSYGLQTSERTYTKTVEEYSRLVLLPFVEKSMTEITSIKGYAGAYDTEDESFALTQLIKKFNKRTRPAIEDFSYKVTNGEAEYWLHVRLTLEPNQLTVSASYAY